MLDLDLNEGTPDSLEAQPVDMGGVKLVVNSLTSEMTADQAETLGKALIKAAKESRKNDEFISKAQRKAAKDAGEYHDALAHSTGRTCLACERNARRNAGGVK